MSRVTRAEHVQEAAWERGYTLLLCSAGYELEKNLECFKTLVERKVDGIISGSVVKDAEALRKLYQTHLNRLPLVSLDYTLPEAHYNISADHFQASVQAVTYLIRLGHVRIAYVGSHRSDREAGYRFALESNGLTVDEALIIRGEGTFAFGSKAAAGLLNRELPPTALFCWNDMMALGAMQSLQQAGLAIPADISVIGYDDIPMASLVNPALTSVRQPLKEIGRAAVQALITEIEGQDQASTNRTSILATEFIIRGSTGVNPGRTGNPS
ncbi:substrate-binding domain-containing protein [Paenibacillus sp. MAH-36]|uniref:Substrate-binding domain-containing protein n=1 Tax=Paenibacillus violae TaxID=3077234 RepID=A0ABU3RD18_9BACL|nr:substrate-binding domain-containing protein [Paenibacillus sp. PFR10]MDU0202163.1 substrate-binding domain-containing protein [Paenibacillus sp. PFR10]